MTDRTLHKVANHCQKYTKVKSFPPEILLQIFSLLKTKKDKISCLCVCRSWHRSISHIVYNRIEVNNDVKRLEQLKFSLEESLFANAYLVKSLSINKQPDNWIEKMTKPDDGCKALISILGRCPNLQALGILANSVFWKYLYEETGHAIQLNNLQRLQPLGVSQTFRPRLNEAYFYLAAYRFRASLLQLEIFCSCDETIQKNYTHILNYLQQFPKIRYLSIKSGSRKYLVHLQELLDTCKRLTRLNFQLDHPFFKSEAEKIAFFSSQQQADYPSLEELDVYLPHLSINRLLYVIRRFVNIQKLTLRVHQNESDKWNNYSQDFFNTIFLPYLNSGKLNFFCLDLNINGCFQPIEDIFAKLNCCDFRNVAKAAAANFILHNGRSQRTHIKLTRKKQTQNKDILTLDCTFVRDLSAVLFDDHQLPMQADLPYTKFLHGYGDCLTNVTITHSCLEKTFDLDKIVQLCPNLQQLDLVLESNDRHNIFNYNSSIESLRHDETWFFGRLAQSSQRLATLNLSGAITHPKALERISLCHPHIDQLQLKHCSYYSVLDEAVLFADYHMPNFHLKCFKFDVYQPISAKQLCIVAIWIKSATNACRKGNFYIAREDCIQHVSSERYHKLKDGSLTEEGNDRKVSCIEFTFGSIEKVEYCATKSSVLVKQINFPDTSPYFEEEHV